MHYTSSFVQSYKDICEQAILETSFGTRNSKAFLCLHLSVQISKANALNYVPVLYKDMKSRLREVVSQFYLQTFSVAQIASRTV